MVSGGFTVNGVAIAVDASTDTFASLVVRINGAGAGVTAAYDAPTDRLVLIATTDGPAQVASSRTYYAVQGRPASARRVRDEALKVKLRHVHAEHFSVYGVRKLWRQLRCEGVLAARCTVERLVHATGLTGAVGGKPKRTTVADETAPRPADLVQRHFGAPAANRLWVADIAYVRTWSGFVYVAFITNVYSRMCR